jgi:hypothetical protein
MGDTDKISKIGTNLIIFFILISQNEAMGEAGSRVHQQLHRENLQHPGDRVEQRDSGVDPQGPVLHYQGHQSLRGADLAHILQALQLLQFRAPGTPNPTQLNMYSFHKVRGDKLDCEFEHERFLKGHRELLARIKRKQSEGYIISHLAIEEGPPTPDSS